MSKSSRKQIRTRAACSAVEVKQLVLQMLDIKVQVVAVVGHEARRIEILMVGHH